MLSEANVKFYMYTGDRFLKYAEDFLQLSQQPETIEEAKEIRLQEEIEEEGKEKLHQISTIQRKLPSFEEIYQLTNFEQLSKSAESLKTNKLEFVEKISQMATFQSLIEIFKILNYSTTYLV